MTTQVQYYENKLKFEIDAWDLQAARKAGNPVIVLDARGPAAFDAEHIQGAISFPHANMTEAGTAGFSGAATYVVYCDGLGCNASTNAALKLAKLGFQTKELTGGLDWWKEKGYPTEGQANRSGSAYNEATPAIACACD